MPRWAPDASERIRHAAFQLFADQGFAATTVAQIAANAGLTRRTFFRHFADKREVIFGGDEIPAYAAQLMADSPAGLAPVEVIATGLTTVADTRFQGRRDEVRMVRQLIHADGSLQERDLAKRQELGEVVANGFTTRGLDPSAAAMLAEITVAALHLALDEWLDRDDEVPLRDLVTRILRATVHALAPA